MDPHTHPRMLFRPAPAPVRGLVASVLEPSIAIAALLAVLWLSNTPLDTASFVLSVLTLALASPGRDRFDAAPLQAAWEILRAWLAVLLVLALVGAFLHRVDLLPWPALLAWAVATPLAQWGASRLGHAVLARGVGVRRHPRDVVVIGSGPWGARVARTLTERSDSGVRVLGFFDDRDDARLDLDVRGRRLGSLREAAAYVRLRGVVEVHITLPLQAHPRMRDLLDQLQSTTASVFYVPDVMGIGVIQGRLEDRDGLPMIGLCETPFTGINLLVKRASDLVLAGLALVLLSPVMLAVAVGVRLSGPGPVIFRQRRNGLGGEEIVVYKFRSMRTLDDGRSVRQATRDDPRMTRFGRFIRRTSLDELPQFINVLQGRMSVVGPRPHAVAHNELYRDVVKAYMVRHKVRPGITGWAQVNGHRGETDTIEKMQARVDHDLEYLRNWSLGLDLRIIARTIRLVFADSRAY